MFLPVLSLSTWQSDDEFDHSGVDDHNNNNDQGKHTKDARAISLPLSLSPSFLFLSYPLFPYVADL